MRLIDADALLEEILPRYIGYFSMAQNAEAETCANVINEIKNAKTIDAVPVVRCKDCKYSKPIPCKHSVLCTYGEPYESYSHEPDWFCADGERRESK